MPEMWQDLDRGGMNECCGYDFLSLTHEILYANEATR